MSVVTRDTRIEHGACNFTPVNYAARGDSSAREGVRSVKFLCIDEAF